MEDPGHLTPRTAIAEYYRSVTPRSTQNDRRIHRSYSHEDLSQRPRSNPRTRTPLRNPSPLMIGTTLETPSPILPTTTGILEAHYDEESSLHSQHSSQRRNVHPTGRIAFGAAMPSGTSVQRRVDYSRRNISSDVESNHATPWQGTSRKSAPSHRKQRRWNNDRFQLSDLSYDFNIRTFHHPEINKKEYLMPNDTLLSSSQRQGVFSTWDQMQPEIREKIIRGDVVHDCNTHTMDSSSQSSRRLKKIGIDQISPRLIPFLTRACQSTYIQNVIRMMEQTLYTYFYSSSISLLEDVSDKESLIESLINNSILQQSPECIIHNKNKNASMKMVRFHFHDKCPSNHDPLDSATSPKTTQKEGSTKNPAFYRLVLHSIGQYHGYSIHTTCYKECKIMSVMAGDGKIEKDIMSCGYPCSLLDAMDGHFIIKNV